MALDFLRSATLQPTVSPHFEERVLRRLRVYRVRDSWLYWSPAVSGAVIAGFTFVAAMQLVTASPSLPVFRHRGQEARLLNISRNDLPLLLLEPSASVDRDLINGANYTGRLER